MRWYRLIGIVLFTILSSSAFSQLFIGSGGGSVDIRNATGGTLGAVDASNLVALYVDGDIIINGAYANQGAETHVTGNLTGSGIFSTSGDEVFIGGLAQTLFVTGDLHNLILNKTAGTTLTLGANTSLSSTGILRFGTGGIVITSGNYLYVGNTASSAIVGSSVTATQDKYIEGRLRRNVATSTLYTFPVGASHVGDVAGNGNQIASLRATSGSGIVEASFTEGSGNPVLSSVIACPSNTMDPLYKLGNGSWTITNPGGGIAQYNLTLNPGNFTFTSYNDYTILKDNAATGLDVCDNIPTGLPVTLNGFTSFSDFEVVGTASPLPITLLYFKAVAANKGVITSWVTAQEIGNDFFTVERSRDGEVYETVGIVQGAGTHKERMEYQYTDALPYNGLSYYRLKQTDFDKKVSYAQVVSVTVTDLPKAFQLYPNPTKDAVTIKTNDLTQPVAITLFDSRGMEVATHRMIFAAGQQENVLDMSLLKSGLYLVIVNHTIHRVIKL